MQTWLRISLLLCTFGFFREMRPSEPFVTEYLSGPWRNITQEQVVQEIYPVGTYACLAQLVIVFLITDILRYKPIIVISAIAGIILFGMLLWVKHLWELKIAQLFYGTFMASEVAYYTYIYAKVEKSRYQVVTGHTRSAILCGKFLGGVLAQLFVSFEIMDYRELTYVSFGSQIVSLFIAIALPSVSKSLYFYTDSDNLKNSIDEVSSKEAIDGSTKSTQIVVCTPANGHFSWRKAFQLLWQHTVSAYTNPIVLQWSLWWSLATCGQLQVISYVQALWQDINDNGETFYNGAVEATVTLLGAAGAMAAGHMTNNKNQKWHLTILTACTLSMGIFLLISAVTKQIWIAYLVYVLFGIMYFFIITIASSIVAENVCEDSFGLIFGINTLVALTLQTLLTVTFVTGLKLNTRQQFIVYGSYFGMLAVLFLIAALIQKCRTSKAKLEITMGK